MRLRVVRSPRNASRKSLWTLIPLGWWAILSSSTVEEPLPLLYPMKVQFNRCLHVIPLKKFLGVSPLCFYSARIILGCNLPALFSSHFGQMCYNFTVRPVTSPNCEGWCPRFSEMFLAHIGSSRIEFLDQVSSTSDYSNEPAPWRTRGIAVLL